MGVLARFLGIPLGTDQRASMPTRVADVAPSPDENAANGDPGAPDLVARYPNGDPIRDSKGQPMQKPPFADLGLAIQRGQDLSNDPFIARIEPLIKWLRRTGEMDYQRSSGREFNPNYQDFTNYVFGGVTGAAGIPPYIAAPAALAYNALAGRWRPGLLGSPWQNIRMWNQGRNDYLGDKLIFPGVAPAPIE